MSLFNCSRFTCAHPFPATPEILCTVPAGRVQVFGQVKAVRKVRVLDVGRGLELSRRLPQSSFARGDTTPTLQQAPEILKLSLDPALWAEADTAQRGGLSSSRLYEVPTSRHDE